MYLLFRVCFASKRQVQYVDKPKKHCKKKLQEIRSRQILWPK